MYIFSKGENLYGYVFDEIEVTAWSLLINVRSWKLKQRLHCGFQQRLGRQKICKTRPAPFQGFRWIILTKTIPSLIFLFPSSFSSSWLLNFASSITLQDNFVVTCEAWQVCWAHFSGEASKARALSRTSGGAAPAPISSQFHWSTCLVWAPDQSSRATRANFLEKTDDLVENARRKRRPQVPP